MPPGTPFFKRINHTPYLFIGTGYLQIFFIPFVLCVMRKLENNETFFEISYFYPIVYILATNVCSSRLQ